MLTDDTPPHYGKLPPVNERFRKRIYLADKYGIDGEDATQMITIGTMAQREAFVDQLPDAFCVDGAQGLEEKFSEWLAEERKNGFKKK